MKNVLLKSLHNSSIIETSGGMKKYFGSIKGTFRDAKKIQLGKWSKLFLEIFQLNEFSDPKKSSNVKQINDFL